VHGVTRGLDGEPMTGGASPSSVQSQAGGEVLETAPAPRRHVTRIQNFSQN
jgi:hypothetical protein